MQNRLQTPNDMPLLAERIRREGRSLEGGILKVDSFLNHQIDPLLMMELAREFVRRFEGTPIDKVLTIESSGIAPATMTGWLLRVPVVFAKKRRPSTMGEAYETEIFSFTKNCTYPVCISREFLQPGERILFIDDFLANGNAAFGILDLVRQAGATLQGIGILIEKSFQPGGTRLREAGIRIESLATI